MIVRLIQVYVKPESVSSFESETTLNHEASLREPGVLRFDVLRDGSRPGTYLLYEVYRDQEAADAHKLTKHYARWKDEVADLMAQPRESTTYEVVAPMNPESWRPAT
ncbi:MAG: antibiotic biosynthesis monooxygenase [Spirochaetaceae bacterium]|nr:MAG: antibiotic biosynthesis monooxygenase [Spirochaetaceae bacterium]